MSGVKVCPICLGDPQPIENFYPRGVDQYGNQKYFSRCKSCELVHQREQRKKFPERHRETQNRWREKNPGYTARTAAERRRRDPVGYRHREFEKSIRYKYGLTVDQWNKMFEDQKGLCALCGVDFVDAPGLSRVGEPKICVDHNHKTGRVRALICDPCNKGLGSFEDDLGLLRLAVKYLEERD